MRQQFTKKTKNIQLFLQACLIILAGCYLTQPSYSNPSPLESVSIEIGHQDAPITIIEYTSLTCDHCATFHLEVLPIIRLKYIDSGKVKFIFRHFPLDKEALEAATAISCLPAEKRLDAVTNLFLNQSKWIGQKPTKMCNLLGMNEAQTNTCLKNNKIQALVLQEIIEAQQKKVDATPTFFIGDKIVEGQPNITEFEALIAKAEAKQPVKS